MKISISKSEEKKLKSEIVDRITEIVSAIIRKPYVLQKVELDYDDGYHFVVCTKNHESEPIILVPDFGIDTFSYTCTAKEIGGLGDGPDANSGMYTDLDEAFGEDIFDVGKLLKKHEKLFIEAVSLAFKLWLSSLRYDNLSEDGLYIMNLQKGYCPLFYQAMKLLEKQGEVQVLEWCPKNSHSEMFSTIFIYE